MSIDGSRRREVVERRADRPCRRYRRPWRAHRSRPGPPASRVSRTHAARQAGRAPPGARGGRCDGGRGRLRRCHRAEERLRRGILCRLRPQRPRAGDARDAGKAAGCRRRGWRPALHPVRLFTGFYQDPPRREPQSGSAPQVHGTNRRPPDQGHLGAQRRLRRPPRRRGADRPERAAQDSLLGKRRPTARLHEQGRRRGTSRRSPSTTRHPASCASPARR